MEINYNYFDIDIADIWQYEQELFLSGKSSKDLARYIIDKAQQLITKEGEESFAINLDNEDERDRKYNERHLEDYKNASNTLEGRYEINYFINKDLCFEYDQQLMVKPVHSDFDFWFALKLRQYDFKLNKIKGFLNYQLKVNFLNDRFAFKDFLQIIFRQFYSVIFNFGVMATVHDWVCTSAAFEKKDFIDQEFLLIGEGTSQQEPLIHIIYDRSILFDVLKPYFRKEDYNNLKLLLSGGITNNKICFNSNANQFVMVFRQLHLNQKIIGTLIRTEHWICNYFTYKNQSSFNADYVHKKLTRRYFDLPKSKRIELPGLEYVKK